MTTTTPWTVTPLTEPLTPAQVRAWRDAHRGVRFGSAMTPLTVILAIPIVLGVVVLMVGQTVSIVATSDRGFAPVAFGALVVLLLAVATAVGFGVRAMLAGSRASGERLMRLVRFAEANGFSYAPRSDAPSYPGMIFGIGRERMALDHIMRSTPRFLDIGNFRYSSGSGKNKRVRTWGFMAVHLDRRVPHMLLDAKANDFIGSNLPAAFSKDQVLSLEGDFDRHFTLYCPREYERDALYVFTPDLMALLIDEAGAFDVEVIDDWMFVYSQQPLPMGDGPQMLRLLRIVDTVGATAVERTDAYADERIGDRRANIVAPQGARLRRGVLWVPIALVALVAAAWLLQAVLPF